MQLQSVLQGAASSSGSGSATASASGAPTLSQSTTVSHSVAQGLNLRLGDTVALALRLSDEEESSAL